MATTTFLERSGTRTWGGTPAVRCSDELLGRYQSLIDDSRLSWTEHHRLQRLLGSGGQGVVYLSQRKGTDGFTLPVALKIFSPERYEDDRAYDEAMGRMAQVAAHVAQIQQDNLLDVHNWVDRRCIRMMEMEWVNGYDLGCLLTREMLDRAQQPRRCQALEIHQRSDRDRRADAAADEAGRGHRHRPRLPGRPGRPAPRGHRAWRHQALEHHDQADRQRQDRRHRFGLRDGPIRRCGGPARPTMPPPRCWKAATTRRAATWPAWAMCSIEMLAGVPAFAGLTTLRDLLEAKRFLAQRLPHLLPEEVVCNELLMSFCRGLIAPDPMRRFPSAEAADLVKEGAASFHRQLIKGDLASEYDNEIRAWLAELGEGE